MGKGKPRAERELTELEKLEETIEELRHVITEAREARRDLREVIKEVHALIETEIVGKIQAMLQASMLETVQIVNGSVEKARAGAVERFETLANNMAAVLTNTMTMAGTAVTALKLDPEFNDATIGETLAAYLQWGIQKSKDEIPKNPLQLVNGKGQVIE